MLSFQDLIVTLQKYWAGRGCILGQAYDSEVGAGTFNPHTFLRAVGPEPWRVAYVQPSRRPSDGRYGENPNRLYQHHQFQVLLKPSPKDIQEIYLGSLRAIGIDPLEHDIRFVHDDWESPTLGAWGLGWEVWCDGMEITQFTYFQQAGGIEMRPVSVELTYGLERICMYLQNKSSVFDIEYGDGITYGEVFKANEIEMSTFTFQASDHALLFGLFDTYEAECKRLLEKELPLPAYDFALKCSHTFNNLDAGGAISVTERQGYILRVRNLSRACAEGYLAMRERLGFPLLKSAWADELGEAPSAAPASQEVR